jgi:hypothetical protein
MLITVGINHAKIVNNINNISTVSDETISKSIPMYIEFKYIEYDVKEFGLLPNEKSTLFIKVFMAKIKYIKRHINDNGFIAKNNIPLNPETKNDKKMLENIKQELLLLLGFSTADIFDPNGKINQFLNKSIYI